MLMIYLALLILIVGFTIKLSTDIDLGIKGKDIFIYSWYVILASMPFGLVTMLISYYKKVITLGYLCIAIILSLLSLSLIYIVIMLMLNRDISMYKKHLTSACTKD